MTAGGGADLRFDALAAATRQAWPGVASCLPEGAYLAGGSALALRLGHRISRDLDVFCRPRFDCDDLIAGLSAAQLG